MDRDAEWGRWDAEWGRWDAELMTSRDMYGHVAYFVFPPSIAWLLFASKKDVMSHLFRPDSFSCLYQYLLWVLGFTVNLDEWICALCFVLCALVYTVLFDPVTQFICWEGKNVPFVSFTAVNLERLTRSEVAPERQSWFPCFRAKGCAGGTQPTAYPSHWKGLKWLICWALVNSSPNFNEMN